MSSSRTFQTTFVHPYSVKTPTVYINTPTSHEEYKDYGEFVVYS